MAGRKRLYLFWDPAIDAATRRAMEAAFGRLNLDAADGETVDIDPDNPGVVAVIASSAGGWAAPKADILIQAGPGEFPQTAGALRLTREDVGGDTPRWNRLVDQLRTKLGMASLALPAEQLEAALDAATQRAEAAERNVSAALLNEANAVRETRQLQLELAKARERMAQLERENERLQKLNESGRFAIGAVPEKLREAVSRAREFARRAELAAAQGVEKAGALPDQIAWSGALYVGETRNGQPHGHGVMTFLNGHAAAGYRGEFSDGRRAGLGVGVAEDGLTWSGEWANNEACGYGVLEAPDGRRFEGRVKPDASGAPKPDEGWRWNAPDAKPPKAMHRPVAPSLPAPEAQAASTPAAD